MTGAHALRPGSPAPVSPMVTAVSRQSIVAAIAGLALCGTVAGCSSTHSRDARIVGLVEVCGAPFPRATPAEQRHCTLQTGSASVFDSAHRLTAHSSLTNGRFDFAVVPGRYTLVTRNGGNGPWKRLVVAVAGQRTIVDFRVEAI
jgi:hypothetical protein